MRDDWDYGPAMRAKPGESRPRIPRTVWTLGFVSMFMDISSEMIHSRLPVFMMGTLGASAALVADTAPENLRGTAFGIFNLASGIAMLAASAVAGLLWSAYGPQYTFVTGALFATLSLVGLFVVTRANKGTIV